MHRCLQVFEVLSQIFSDIDGHVYDTRMRYPTRITHREEAALRTLAGLARTCRAFKEPALDVLWREIPDLFVLIKHLMPEELLRYDEESSELFLRSDPGPDVWRTLEPYVARIRAIGIPPPSGAIASGLHAETVLRPLERHLGLIAADRNVLFPKLEHVVYQAIWTHELYSRLLLHRYLRVLQLPLVAYTPRWTLTPLPGEHNITTVGRSMHTLGSHTLGPLRSMQQLRALWVKSALLDQATFAYLGSLPTLTAFALEVGWGRIQYPPYVPSGPRAFTALREVSVSIAHADAPEFLAHIAPECLEAVNIHWEYLYSDADSSGAVVRSLLTAMSHLPQIKHFCISLDEDMGRTMDLHGEGPGSECRKLKAIADSGLWELELILSFTALRTLEIEIDVVFQVDDEFLMELAGKMPHLESLRLTPLLRGPFPLVYSQTDDDPTVEVLNIATLDGVLAFSERCSRLTKLRLAVRSILSEEPLRPDSALGHGRIISLSPNRVRTLELWATPLHANTPDEAFVSFFADNFPFLEELYVVVPANPADPACNAASGEPTSRNEVRKRWEQILNNLSVSMPRQRDGNCIRWEVI